jgi:amino-acid N-acetyltransferase
VLQPLNDLQITKAGDLGDVKPLLAARGLPTNDIRDDDTFFVARAGSVICGVAGLEALGHVGLLRSVAVDPAWQRRGVAQALVAAIADRARAHGMRQLFLLTTDADRYFSRLGFATVDREALPAEVRDTAQFRETCPQTAIAMSRNL